jgi:hypothetical protein
MKMILLLTSSLPTSSTIMPVYLPPLSLTPPCPTLTVSLGTKRRLAAITYLSWAENSSLESSSSQLSSHRWAFPLPDTSAPSTSQSRFPLALSTAKNKPSAWNRGNYVPSRGKSSNSSSSSSVAAGFCCSLLVSAAGLGASLPACALLAGVADIIDRSFRACLGEERAGEYVGCVQRGDRVMARGMVRQRCNCAALTFWSR